MKIENPVEDISQNVPTDPINLPDPDYISPMVLTSKKAKRKIARHLTFLKQLTE